MPQNCYCNQKKRWDDNDEHNNDDNDDDNAGDVGLFNWVFFCVFVSGIALVGLG